MANYRAALRARSKAEFIAGFGIVVEEADESMLWPELIIESGLLKAVLVEPLLGGTDGIISIMVTTCKSAGNNKS